MKKLLWKIILITTFCTTISSPASSQELKGWLNFTGSFSENIEEGETISETTNFLQNNNFNYTNFITPALSYQLNLRTTYNDNDTTDAEGIEDSSHFRSIRPSVDLSLRNPMYSLRAGYRRDELWSTARITDESRNTTVNYYSNFNLSPRYLPTLSLQFNREETFDHLSPKNKDDSDNRYIASSAYSLPSRDIILSYSASYRYTELDRPLEATERTETDSFNGNYKIGYTRNFWNNRTNISLGYQGNYNWNEETLFVTETGDVLFRRTSFGGLYAQGTTLQPDVDILDPVGWSGLVDEDFNSALAINVGTEEFHNIGIRVSSEKTVDRLYIYVNEDVSTDTNLTNKDNWEVYRSDFNRPETWTEVSIDRILPPEPFDIEEDIYFYVIVFSEPQNASFFKAVTLETVNALGVTDVLVTEIEAYGIDTVPETGELTQESKLLTQRLNFNAFVVPLRKVTFSFSYSIDETESDFDSFSNAWSNVFQNIFSKSTDDEDADFTSRTNRTYGTSATWLAHTLLTTTLRFQRFDSFDNKGTTDTSSDTYIFSLNSAPLPTLAVNLSLTRIESKLFEEKISTSDSIILSTDAELNRFTNMITDVSYTESENFVTEANPGEGKSDAFSISGTIDSSLRKNLFVTLQYNFRWSSSDDVSVNSQEGTTKIIYRPGRFTNISANFSISSSEGNTSTSEGFTISWLPLPAIRTNISYQHSDTEPGPLKTDRFSSNVVWKITKFMTAEFNYNYSKRTEETEKEQHAVTAKLNCRF
jgi:hypothetical protein